MLIKLGNEFCDVAMVEFIRSADADDTGPGGFTHLHGEPGFLRLDDRDGEPVLVNARHVAVVRPNPLADGSGSLIETARGEVIAVSGSPEWVANLLNKARRNAAA